MSKLGKKLIKAAKEGRDIAKRNAIIEECTFPPLTREKPRWQDCMATGIPGASCQFPDCDCAKPEPSA